MSNKSYAIAAVLSRMFEPAEIFLEFVSAESEAEAVAKFKEGIQEHPVWRKYTLIGLRIKSCPQHN